LREGGRVRPRDLAASHNPNPYPPLRHVMPFLPEWCRCRSLSPVA
jgi:hypothetical protein